MALATTSYACGSGYTYITACPACGESLDSGKPHEVAMHLFDEHSPADFGLSPLDEAAAGHSPEAEHV